MPKFPEGVFLVFEEPFIFALGEFRAPMEHDIPEMEVLDQVMAVLESVPAWSFGVAGRGAAGQFPRVDAWTSFTYCL